MKRLQLFLVLVLSISLIATPSFAGAKAGAKCTKAGATSTTGGKKFTCIKSGTKLVWNKGVAVKPPAKPSPTATSETGFDTKDLLASDTRISPISELTNVETCKTEDMTPDYLEAGATSHRNGFPRPQNSSYAKSSAKILVIPIIFEDRPFTTTLTQNTSGARSDLEVLQTVIPEVKDQYKKLSSGRFELTIDVLPRSEWWIFNQSSPLQTGWGINNFPNILPLIEKQKPSFKFDSYDTYVFITGNGFSNPFTNGSGQASFGEKYKGAKDGLFNIVLLVSGWGNPGLWIHELGHSLFAFEDLYLFQSAEDPGKDFGMQVPLAWDLMANAARSELLAWNKLLMGWIKDSEIRCISDQTKSAHYLSNVGAGKESKILAIHLSPGVTLAAESRPYGSDQNGLLLSLINSHVNHGNGPVVSQRSLLFKGESKSLLGWRIKVLESDRDGALAEVIKTDIDKFVPPPPKPKPGNQQQTSSTIKPARGDIVPNGHLKAKATWEVSGHQSYRLYVTDVVDFQKVFFESGYVNDSRGSISIEITGLECNKQFRTITEFYTEKDGKGERVVMPSFQLRDLPCQDPNKKP
jgi:hypothetical protein